MIPSYKKLSDHPIIINIKNLLNEMKPKPLFLFSMYFVIVFVWVCLAVDGRLHWDEPAYLFTGSYFTVPEILAANFQPWDIEGFSFSRIGHLMFVRLVTSIFGPGMISFTVLIGCYLIMLIAFSWASYLILLKLMPSAHGLGAAVLLSSFIPVYVYFAFKTSPEIPALLLASLAVLGFLRSLRTQPVLWLSVVAVTLAAIVLTKNNMVILYASFVGALILCPVLNYQRKKIIQYAFFSGIGSLVIFFGFLWATGIPLNRYLAGIHVAVAAREPLESLLLHAGLEGGLFFLVLPLSFLSSRKREAIFLAIWFGLATIPLLLVLKRMEARYLAGNLIALTGLIYLSIDGLALRVKYWWAKHRISLIGATGVGVSLLVASIAATQLIMAHEVRIWQFHTILRDLDKVHGCRDYAILTPWEYSNFHYLRFMYPQRNVYTVHQRMLPGAGGVDTEWADFQKQFYGQRAIQNIDQLRALDTNLVYLGFEESFPIANLRALIQKFPLSRLRTSIGQKMDIVADQKHFEESWMWDNPRIKFTKLARHGHYVAMRVEIIPAASNNNAILQDRVRSE